MFISSPYKWQLYKKQHQLQTVCTLDSLHFYTQYGQFRKEKRTLGSTTFNTLWPDDHQPLLTLAIETGTKNPRLQRSGMMGWQSNFSGSLANTNWWRTWLFTHTWNWGGKQTSTYKQEQKGRKLTEKENNGQESIQNNSTEKYEPYSLQ